MKNVSSYDGHLWKYHFVNRFPEVEVWLEKYSKCFDTGHRLNMNILYSKTFDKACYETIKIIEGNFT